MEHPNFLKFSVPTKTSQDRADGFIIIFHMCPDDSSRTISDTRVAGTESRAGNEVSDSAWNCEITGVRLYEIWLIQVLNFGVSGTL